MHTNIKSDTIVASLTVGQLVELVSSLISAKEDEVNLQTSTRYVYGLRGIQDLLHCSHTQAQRYKDGLLKPAVMQNGRKIVVDADKALALFAEKEVRHEA